MTTPGAFTVILPTYQRARTLPRALDSLIAQTHEKWVCWVLDDGSTDDTLAVVAPYLKREPLRIRYTRHQENRGGVKMNEIGMSLASRDGSDFWTRLGSDDWFGPRKLELDAACLVTAEACYGPYLVNERGVLVGYGPHGLMLPRGEANALLLGTTTRGGMTPQFFVGWPNVAVRSSVLRKVEDRFGNFVPPELRNMEDFVFNARVAHLGIEWTFRTDPTGKPEAFWNCEVRTGDPVSASANQARSAKEYAMSQRIIREMTAVTA